MNVVDRIIALGFIVIALAVTIFGEVTFFEGFVCVLLGNILLAIREQEDA